KAIRAEAGMSTRGSHLKAALAAVSTTSRGGGAMPRTLAEIKAEQTQLRTRVGTLVDEARAIEIKLEVDGANDGLEERKANVERGKAKASARLAELGAEYSAAITRMVESGATRV